MTGSNNAEVSPNPLVIIPALNEARSVSQVVSMARSLGYVVCVVDDGSTDMTAQTARSAGATVLRLPLNLGVGGALRCGFRYAVAKGYSTVVQVDGDGQHNPNDIPAMLKRMVSSDADMVIGSRFITTEHRYPVAHGRRFAMRVLAWRASRSVRAQITDATSGFRVIRAPLLGYFAADYPVEYLGDTVEALIAAGYHGARVVEHPIQMSPRRHGDSSAGVMAGVWYVVRVLLAASLMRGRSARRTSGQTLLGHDEELSASPVT
ncbi:MAG TPA: glycosyltransferase family 2 protein [Solirubrobacteraceae bacterium]|jgi:glycosyltransferase involved in cell wall biosynthesis